MAGKAIAVQGCVLNHKSGSTITGGTFTVSSTPSTKVKCVSKGIFETPLQYTFSGGNFAGCVPGSVATTAPQTIAATAVKTKGETKLVIRKEDFGTMSAIGTLTAGGTTPVVGPVEVADAGQTKVLAV